MDCTCFHKRMLTFIILLKARNVFGCMKTKTNKNCPIFWFADAKNCHCRYRFILNHYLHLTGWAFPYLLNVKKGLTRLEEEDFNLRSFKNGINNLSPTKQNDKICDAGSDVRNSIRRMIHVWNVLAGRSRFWKDLYKVSNHWTYVTRRGSNVRNHRKHF